MELSGERLQKLKEAYLQCPEGIEFLLEEYDKGISLSVLISRPKKSNTRNEEFLFHDAYFYRSDAEAIQQCKNSEQFCSRDYTVLTGTLEDLESGIFCKEQFDSIMLHQIYGSLEKALE
ncbi:MAG TPA: hypothetical protein HA360_04100 [Nanoarchaeota archaeon]|nr:hypothetical protein [Nanoarchaeota archaeon]HIH59479.1 hypothetical protein [Nanoarchaeota archaeon]HII14230.1 hypothetical protein [Nanoarchaeota archaeon]